MKSTADKQGKTREEREVIIWVRERESEAERGEVVAPLLPHGPLPRLQFVLDP